MPTQKDVAKRADISVATVSRYINEKGYISPAVKERIRSAIEDLQYKPNLVARSLKMRSSNIIGLIFPDIENPFFISLIKKAEEVAQKNGYNVILCNTKNNPGKEAEYLEVLKGKQVDGYILIPSITTGSDIWKALRNEKVVFLDRAIDEGGECITVKLDNRKGVKIAIDCLAGLGHRRIGTITVPINITTGFERLEGYRTALSANNLRYDAALVRTADYTAENAYLHTQDLLAQSDRPTALLPMSGPTTVGALKAIKDAGLQIPRDISVIGFDEFEYAKLLNPPLSTIAQPAYEFGEKGIELLLRLLRGEEVSPTTVILDPIFMERDSCRGI